MPPSTRFSNVLFPEKLFEPLLLLFFYYLKNKTKKKNNNNKNNIYINVPMYPKCIDNNNVSMYGETIRVRHTARQ